MAEYTKVFDNPYPNGWEDLPSENTPITASALQEHTDAIEHLEQYLEDNPIEKGGTEVDWNQIVTSGTKIAEVTIGEEKTDVFAPEGGGSTIEVIDNLESDSSTDALSAKQGNVLKTSIPEQIFEQAKDGFYKDCYSHIERGFRIEIPTETMNKMLDGTWNTEEDFEYKSNGITYDVGRFIKDSAYTPNSVSLTLADGLLAYGISISKFKHDVETIEEGIQDVDIRVWDLNKKSNFGTTSDFEVFKQRTDIPIGATYHVTDDYIEGSNADAPDLIWENDNKSAVFAAQTLQLDLSEYRFIQVYFATFSGNGGTVPSPLFPTSFTALTNLVTSGTGSASYLFASTRTIQFGVNTITFGGGLIQYANKATRENANNVVVPYYIYGIR